ncbi:MAG: DUF3738 domain-containing protein, partial [Chitinophagaceae bacterium]|nr:DUF3738 domain-containing protein [Chitinophagaceae bacterium]
AYSFISGYIPAAGESNGLIIKTDSPSNTIVALNVLNKSVADLYRVACLKRLSLGDKYKILIESKDSQTMVLPVHYDLQYFEFLEKHTFSYALKVTPGTSDDSVFAIMRQDLNRFFKLNGGLEKRKVKVFVLKQEESLQKSIAKEDEPKQRGVHPGKKGEAEFLFLNAPMHSVSNFLNGYITEDLNCPFVNETSFKGMINIRMPWSFDGSSQVDLKKLQDSLRKQGLSLVEEYREMEMLVIKDAL